jgi:hypothetical protein
MNTDLSEKLQKTIENTELVANEVHATCETDLTCLRRFSDMVLILEFIFRLVSLFFETASQVAWTSFATNSVFSIVFCSFSDKSVFIVTNFYFVSSSQS